MAHLTVPPRKEYRRLWVDLRDKTAIVFSVRGCMEAGLLMTQYSEIKTASTYEIIIGSHKNRRTTIKRNLDGQDVDTKDTPGILSCTESRQFWLLWINGTIGFGRGEDVNIDTVLTWDAPSTLDVNALSVSSRGESETSWYFQELNGNRPNQTGFVLYIFDCITQNA